MGRGDVVVVVVAGAVVLADVEVLVEVVVGPVVVVTAEAVTSQTTWPI